MGIWVISVRTCDSHAFCLHVGVLASPGVKLFSHPHTTPYPHSIKPHSTSGYNAGVSPTETKARESIFLGQGEHSCVSRHSTPCSTTRATPASNRRCARKQLAPRGMSAPQTPNLRVVALAQQTVTTY